MKKWTLEEIKKIVKIYEDALVNKKNEKIFSKYSVQSFFVNLRFLTELGEFSTNSDEKAKIKFFADVSLHPELNGLYKNNFVKPKIDVLVKSFTETSCETLINELFSMTTFLEVITFVSNKYSLGNFLLEEKNILELYVKFMWLIVNKPLNIKYSNKDTINLLFKSDQKERANIIWSCTLQGTTYSKIFTFS